MNNSRPESDFVKPGERVDDLELNGLKIIQDPGAFCFGTDAVLLANFAKVKRGETVLDLCTGCGVVPVLLCGKTAAKHITGLEIQESCAGMAARSVAMNGLGERIEIVAGDVKDARRLFGSQSCDVVTVNPPYIESAAGVLNACDPKTIARHEILCTLEDVISASARALKMSKRFYMVHRPERLADIMCLMRQYGLEPKKLQFACARAGLAPSLVLVEGRKGGKPGLKALPEIVMEELGLYR
ncbi:MAG: tRNA1(Val) (adenine(37)-N6)-methyltransferase [Defluviitaleaceae bacterium]|nr:tRNA1(Val) (adenine(37)-N6)-methyltransferase [Defluviitaleaceae bacterium]